MPHEAWHAACDEDAHDRVHAIRAGRLLALAARSAARRVAGFSAATVALASHDPAATAAALEAWLPRLDAHERREEALLGSAR